MSLSLRNNKSLIAGILIVSSALLTHAKVFTVFGVNPNLLAASLAVWVFFMDGFFMYFLLAGFGAIILKSYPAFDWPSVAFLILPALFILFKIISPLRPLPTIAFSAILGTMVFYAIIDYNFLITHFLIVLSESALNGAWAGAIFGLLKRFTRDWVV